MFSHSDVTWEYS